MYGYKARDKNPNLLEQVYKQGLNLRMSIVETILQQDPLHYHKTYFGTHNLKSISNASTNEISVADKHKCLAYLNGDPLSDYEEKQVLDTFRTLSTSDICDLTIKPYNAVQNNCKCDTCRAYQKLHFFTPNVHGFKGKLSSRGAFANANQSNGDFLQYVNSLKVTLYSLTITNEGKIKLMNDAAAGGKKSVQLDDLTNITYFIEYEIPLAIRKYLKKKSRVDTGLNSGDQIKICSKKISENVVYIKQVIIHEITNINNLDDIVLKFKVTCRSIGQKKQIVLGVGKFNFADFYQSPTLTTAQELVIFLNENSPIITGSMKIQLQLGCDKLYFGKEFLDSVQTSKENRTVTTLSSSTDILNTTFTLPEKLVTFSPHNSPKKLPIRKTIEQKKSIIVDKQVKNLKSIKCSKKNVNNYDSTPKQATKNLNSIGIQCENEVTKDTSDSLKHPKKSLNHEQTILFGFIFISEVEYLDPRSETYFTCQPFCQSDFVCSNVELGGVRPTFNFHQIIPYIYDEEFVFKLRDNHMIIEFFEKSSEEYNYGDKVIGICRIPLHQYYLAFRNPVIVKYLARNRLPVIGTDWYEPITNPTTGVIEGNVQILVSLGTEEQILNLQRERGFMDDIVRKTKKFVRQVEHSNSTAKDSKLAGKTKANLPCKSPLTPKPKRTQDKHLQTETPRLEKLDKSTIVSPKITSSKVNDDSKNAHLMEQCNKVDNRLETIQNYLQQLVDMKSQSESNAENQSAKSTSMNNLNEPNPVQNLQLRRTSELLGSLESVLSGETHRETFKVQIVAESALHLPARKKCRVKKVKGKIVREELLPSTYVSYQIKDGVVKTSQVVQKSTSPTWNFRSEVSLPADYLTNRNRRLIFKVWKKSNNGSTIPNMQIDTVIGFATVDLTVLLAGLPTIEGWFNIMDFNNKCNGQIKINVKPLENITKYNKQSSTQSPVTLGASSMPELLSLDENSETFSRALKRKFIELDEIHQRLKARLNDVTDDIINDDDGDTINDEMADEFEKDINTLVVEEDYDLLDFAKEAQDLNMHRVSSSLTQWQKNNVDEVMVTTDDNKLPEQKQPESSDFALHFSQNECDKNLKPFVPFELDLGANYSDSLNVTSTSGSLSSLDKQLVAGKERIDHLLQKLSLISKNDSDAFSSRYVSGCSTSHDVPANVPNRSADIDADILTELGIKDFDAGKLFDKTFESFNGNLVDILSNASERVRDEPDGEGNVSSDDKQSEH